MPLNKSKGNMFDWVTHCWNPIFGECSHDCSYCYMKSPRFKLKPLAFRSNEVHSIYLGEGKTIFIGSGTDMFAEEVPFQWIVDVLKKCNEYPDNTYLFQTKNPARYHDERFKLPQSTIFGTTIESNSGTCIHHNAPRVYERAMAMANIHGIKTVTIEPIIDFGLKEMIYLIAMAKPHFVSIGADSKGHNLPEPPYDKVEKLIEALEKFTEVKIKSNLERLRK